MTYLDHGATSFPKLPEVRRAVHKALERCANPGRGGYGAAMEAAKTVYGCREAAAKLFECAPEQVVFTANCTHGLNIAIETLVKPGSRVVVSGFEHNAVTRPLYARKVGLTVAGRRLFDWADTLDSFAAALKKGADAAVFTHVSNVFGYILPVEEMAALCRSAGVPFILDAAQSAGVLPVSLKKLGADYIAMPGHKGLLGPQGAGILLCGSLPKPLLHGGTGSASRLQEMPDFLPDRAEAGTLNVPGIAGLAAGIRYVSQEGTAAIARRERRQARYCAEALKNRGFRVFSGEHQGGTVSFVGKTDCEELAAALAQQGIAVRSGLHCAPLAHESAGTLDTGTVRVSFGYNACDAQTRQFLQGLDGVRA
ncbi:MAG: aminotransferase class V-fold PLP-dependent enzyme [Oscillospiraceae bacterium]|nr:aminotransferase class V-fold PLP-dependent enzyme [Oscillospiraceae bacterium]